MKPVELMVKYYEGLEKGGTKLGPKDKEHLAQCRRILAVALNKVLDDTQRLSQDEMDEEDYFDPSELPGFIGE